MELPKPEVLAEYVNFFLDFSRHPIATIEKLTAVSEGERPQVKGKLFLFLVLSVGVGILISYIGGAANMAPDNSDIVQVVGRVDKKILPLAMLVLIVIFAMVVHVIFLVVGAFQGIVGEERFKGSTAGAINGFTAFAAWAIPLMMTVIVVIRIVDGNSKPNPLIFLPFIMALSLAFIVYLIAALAAGYRIGIGRAAALVGFTVVLFTWISDWVR